jgi:hypothetical protein
MTCLSIRVKAAPNAPARQKRFKVCPIKSVGTIMCATITLVCIIRSTDEALETFPCLYIAEFLVKSSTENACPKLENEKSLVLKEPRKAVYESFTGAEQPPSLKYQSHSLRVASNFSNHRTSGTRFISTIKIDDANIK